jgi:transcription antitermination factor NusG
MNEDKLNKIWYVIRSKPNKEQFLAGQLESRAVEFYYPQLFVHPVNPRSRKIRPYFPGYLFIHTDLTLNHSVLFERIPGASGLVYLGGEVGYIPENIMRAIQLRVDEINGAGGELFESLHKGDLVKIHTGPFEGYEAIFDSKIDGTERVKVLLSMLKGRQLPVELPAGFMSLKKAALNSR